MATLPDLSAFGPRPSAASPRALAPISPQAAAAPAEAVAQLGRDATVVGLSIIDREATAAAKERDAYVSDQIRKILYDPESGFMNKSGSNAVGAVADVQKQLDTIREQALKGLSKPAQKKIEGALRSRMESALDTIDRHTSGERRNWLDTSSAARMEAARQDAIFDVGNTNKHLALIRSEVLGKAQREGWDQPTTELAMKQEVSKVYVDQIKKAAIADPVAALTYLQDKSSEMLPSDVATLQAALAPEAKKWLGRKKGEAAARRSGADIADAAMIALGKAPRNWGDVQAGIFAGESGGDYDALLNYQNRPGGAFNDVKLTTMTVDDAIAFSSAGGRYAEYSKGAVGRMATPMGAYQIVGSTLRAAKDALGLTGDEVMNEALQDRLGQWIYATQGTGAWEGYRGPVRGGGYDSLLDIEDPVEREAAIQEYDLRTKVRAAETKAEQDAAGQAGYQMAIQGTDPRSLTLDQKMAIGEKGMSSLMTFYGKLQAKEPIVTDRQTYYRLSLMRAEDPAAFAQEPLLKYVDKLSQSDFQTIVGWQTSPTTREDGSAASTLMETASRKMQAAGIRTGSQASEAELRRAADIQTQMLKWQDGFIAKEGRKPTPLEIDQEAGRRVLSVVINPAGMANEKSTNRQAIASIDMSPDVLGTADITIGETTVPAAVVKEQVDAMQKENLPVTAETLVDRLVALMAGLN